MTNEDPESEQRFRAMFDTAATGIAISTPAGRFLQVNAAYCRMLGYTEDELLGRDFASLTHPEDLHLNLKLRDELLAGRRESFVMEKRYFKKNGDIVWTSHSVSATRSAAGTITTLAVIAEDITERKRAEEKLRARQAELQVLLDLVPAMLCIKDTNNVFLRVNRRLAEASGKTVEELEGRHAREIYPREADKYYADDLEVIRSRKPVLGIVETLRGPDGEERWVHTDKVPVRGADGEVTAIVLMIQDITEKKKLEERLRQMQKMESIGTLAAGVAHDFNNILAVIQVQVDLLKNEAGLSPAHTGMIQGIGEAAQRATALTRQLLLFGRKNTMQQRDLDLNVSVEGVAGMLRRILGEDVELEFKRSPRPVFVHADAGMMDQALMNLAVNSRDAMPKGGRLVIETSLADFDETVGARSAQARPGAFACLSVSDTGCGIPEGNLLRIFEPFFTTKEVGKGTGLGLATLFGIVQQHRGWVDVYSEVGKGTVFRIYLPRLSGMSEQTTAQPAETPLRGGDETILLVEDDEFLRPYACRVLAQFGYRVLAVGDGMEALEAWKRHRGEIQLLLTDMIMPSGMSGKELGEKLLKENPRLKVIYASGYSPEFASRDFLLEEGVNFIAKPFQAQKLAQIIRRSLDSR